jgi:hypothetical protein
LPLPERQQKSGLALEGEMVMSRWPAIAVALTALIAMPIAAPIAAAIAC